MRKSNDMIDSCSLRPHLKKNIKAFTLVELIVVIAVVFVLIALGVSFQRQSIKSAESVKALSNLRSIGVGILSYTQDSNNFLPSIYTIANDGGFYGWPYLLDYRGYLNDGICTSIPESKISLQKLYNPATRRINPSAINAGGFGLNGFTTTVPIPEGISGYDNNHRRYNLLEFSKASKIVVAADGQISPDGQVDWALLDSNGFVFKPSTLSKGGAHYLFADWHVEYRKAENPDIPNSFPVGYGEDIIFNPNN